MCLWNIFNQVRSKEKVKKIFLIFYLLLGSLSLCSAGGVNAGISLLGSSGLLNIPTAEILPDREICFGFSYIPKPYAFLVGPEYNNTAYYCSMGYLPFLEIDLRITRVVNWKEYTFPIGDRMASFRVRLTKEQEHLPAIAFGIQDVISLVDDKESSHFNALYLVGSKTLSLPFDMKTGIHLGIGTDWMKANEHHLVGIFGGMDLKINKFVSLIAEHDTEKINLGAKLTFLSRINLIIAFLNAESLSGGINFSFTL